VLRNEDLRARLRQDVEHKIASLGSYDSVQIARLYVTGRKYEGRRLGELAAARGSEPFEFLRRLLIREKGGGSMVGFGMNDRNTDRILRDRFCAIASDGSSRAVNGPLGRGMPHPRNFGTFPRVLGDYVRERRVISMREAVRKMTSLPASILGLKERGQVRAGYHADLVLFDPDTVDDRATFLQPKQYSRGIRYVIVGGTVVVDGGDHTDARPGQVLGAEAFMHSLL
jgi:N-acyl-D-amino-acid deacylase